MFGLQWSLFALEASAVRPINTSSKAPLASIDSKTGKLYYGPYANNGQSNKDNIIPDWYDDPLDEYEETLAADIAHHLKINENI